MIDRGIALFKGRKLLIATKHQKESVIAPVLEKELGVHCFVNDAFDTDSLGTFTGEIERKLDPISTVREKCLQAMDASNCDLAVASEGSFGSHPSLYFVTADDEFLIFIDRKHNLEILVRELSTSTNFDGKQIHNDRELRDFASQAHFPSHGLILRKSKDEHADIVKGLTDEVSLLDSFNFLITKHGSVYVETDMRAMYNPMRMSVIENAATQLVEKVKSCCPQCQIPGFGVTDVQKGLPCGLCGMPTNSTLSFIYSCKQCSFTAEEMHPNQKTVEDPMYCDNCNP